MTKQQQSLPRTSAASIPPTDFLHIPKVPTGLFQIYRLVPTIREARAVQRSKTPHPRHPQAFGLSVKEKRHVEGQREEVDGEEGLEPWVLVGYHREQPGLKSRRREQGTQ
jgi:hypothetical protein